MRLLHRATSDAQLRPIEDVVFTFRAFALSEVAHDANSRRVDVVLYDRGLATGDEDPEEVRFKPELLLRFNDVSSVAEPEVLIGDPYELDIYELDDVRYSPAEHTWTIKGSPLVEIRLSASSFDLELYRVAET